MRRDPPAACAEPTEAQLRDAYARLQAERPELQPYEQAIGQPEVALVVRVVARAIAAGRYGQPAPARHRPRAGRGTPQPKAPARRPDAKQRQAHDIDPEDRQP